MQVFNKVRDIQEYLEQVRCAGKKIGFVPTMGALHEGHASLIRCSKKNNDITVVSIFVNPTQFGPNEDYEKYPRTIEKDKELLNKLGVEVLFLPEVSEMYPNGKDFMYMSIDKLSKHWCGASRPTHFNGVILVVSKLFNIIRPHNAYFGQKDYQQYVIIKNLVKELFFDINIVMVPIVREEDGLALSSRNKYLSQEERKIANYLYKTLVKIKEEYKSEKDVDKLIKTGKEFLASTPFKLDYLGIANGNTLEPLRGTINEKDKPVVLIAGYLGKTRLIDNILLFEPKKEEVC